MSNNDDDDDGNNNNDGKNKNIDPKTAANNWNKCWETQHIDNKNRAQIWAEKESEIEYIEGKKEKTKSQHQVIEWNADVDKI